ncbi:MAG TPA: archease [Rhodocyclaceae bacterium]|nr:archease [Rhodocyclaceae bacterium]
MNNWAHFRHGADIGVRGFGATREEAFVQAALALTAVITDPALVASMVPVVIACDAPDDELLLVDWLNALIFEMSTRRMLFGRFEVAISGSVLEATAWGETIDVERHHPAVEVKGATYTELDLSRRPDGRWRAQCVVDV